MSHSWCRSLIILAALALLACSGHAAVEIYGAKASQFVPAFIDYTLNCQADVTIQIRPSDAGGTPTGAAVRTVTFTGLARGDHRFIWLAEQDDTSTAPQGYYVAELSATSTVAAWGPIIGPYTGVNPTVEGGTDPGTTEGFYGTAVNMFPATGQYYGRIYVAHKTQKDILMYGPDGAYIGKFDDSAISWGASAPWDVAVADDGYVYVADRSEMFCYCFTPDGQFVSKSPTQTNHRAIFARKTSDGRTHIFHSGGTVIKKMWVEPDHVTWQATPFGGTTLFAASGASNCGMWSNADNTTVYVASNGGTYNGVSKWNLVSGAWLQDAGFTVGPPTPPAAGQNGTTDVTFVGGAVPSLWINRQVSSTYFPVRKSDPATNAMISEFGSPLNWGLMISNDGVGNIAANWGHSTWTWANHYWALFAEAGTYTCSTKRTTAFQLTATPSPVVVPGSAVWTADNKIAADDYDTASVSFKIMDVNGWADITSCTVDLRPIGYSATAPCSLSQDVSDATGKTAIATLSGIKAKVGTRCTTSFGQPVHFLTATPVDASMGSNTDTEELKLQVTGDPYFDANIRHTRVSTWFISGAQIKAVGGGIPGATDPRAQGPFTYYSAPSNASGYAKIDLSTGSFAVTAAKTGFESISPMNVISPYGGGQTDLYLRPLTIAECRATPNRTMVNVEGICFAQPKGLAPTAANGLETRTDTSVKRGQWYVCDPNSPGNGMLFMITAPSDTFPFQWDNVNGVDFLGNTTYIGKRPAVGETTMITGLLDIPGGHERRVLIQNPDVENGVTNRNIHFTYCNLGDLGGLPATPVNLAITDFSHGVTQSFHEAWGKFAKTDNAIVLGYTADGTETGMTPIDNVPYLTVADAAGHTAQIAIDKPATLGNPAIPSIGSVYTFTGAAGRRERYGSGCIRIRGASDMVQTAAAQAVLKVNLVDQAAGAVTGAQWRRVGETTWLNSGALELLAAGSYDVEFKPVTNYVTPANANVSVTVGAVTTVTGTYTKYGTLKVTLLPAAAVTAGAQWRRVGEATWLNSAASESLPPGDYTVEFKPITGFTAPAPLAVTIVAATANNQTATYSDSLSPTCIMVTIQPPEAVAAGAQWRRVGTTDWLDSGATECEVPAGDNPVEFRDLYRWLRPAEIVIPVSSGGTAEAEATYLPGEDFESGDFSEWPWQTGGDAAWTVSADSMHEGAYSAKSGDVGDSQTTFLEITLDRQAGDISFYRRVSSQQGYDSLRFKIDGVEKSKLSGELAWDRQSFPVEAGIHTYRWEYSKDSSTSEGEDAAWVDYISFPPAHPAPTVVGIAPSVGTNTGSVAAEITGTGFMPGLSVKLAKSGETEILATDVSVVSDTRITCTFDLAGRTPGSWDVVVTNPDTQSATLANGFTVIQGSPVQWSTSVGGNGHWYQPVYAPTFITWAEADAAARSVGGYLVTIASEFENSFAYSLISDNVFWHFSNNYNGPWIGGYQDHNTPDYLEPAGGWRWVTDEPLSYTNWDARQPDNGGGVEDCMHFWGDSNGKTSKWNDCRDAEPILGYVVEYDLYPVPAPMVAGITPAAGSNTGSVSITELAGAYFQAGATVRLTRSGQPGIVATGVTVINASTIECTFDLTGKAIGDWDVVVINLDGQSGVLPAGFTVCAMPDTPVVTDDGKYTGDPVELHAAWQPVGGAVEYQYSIEESGGEAIVGWTSCGTDTEKTVTGLSLHNGETYYWRVKAVNPLGFWGEVGSSDGITVVQLATVAQARNQYPGKLVLVSDAAVTSTGSDFPGLWVESSDRASGLRIPAGWAVNRGDRLQIAGVVQSNDGTPLLANAVLEGQAGGLGLKPISLNNRDLAPDLRECLDYSGVNPVGLLVSTWGSVTRIDTASRVFYVNDGSVLTDGMGPSYDPFIGIRVAYRSGIIPPAKGKYVVVTGIRSVEKITLAYDAFVNGEYRSAGETLYLPVIVLRDQADIVIRK